MKGFGIALVSAVVLSGAASLAVANAGAPPAGGMDGQMGGQPGQPAGQPGQPTGQAGQPAQQPGQPAGQAGGMGQGDSMGQPGGGQPQGAPGGGQPPAQGAEPDPADGQSGQSVDEMVDDAESQAGEPPERIDDAGADAGRFEGDE